MTLETEAKIKVEHLEPIAQRLGQLGAQCVAELVQNDVYFLDANQKMTRNRCGLRLRTETGKSETVSLLTFKGPPKKSRYKSRPEYETRIADVEAMRHILEGLGYRESWTVTKTRSVWEWGGCEVCLDTVPALGCFVEVEGPDETAIKKVLTELGLADEPHVIKGYAALLEKAEMDDQIYKILNMK